MPAKIIYNDKTIASVAPGQTATVNIKGSVPRSQLIVDLSEMHNGTIVPALQEKTITENGEYMADSEYDGLSKVTVNVPIPDGYIKPSGTKEITSNGNHNVTNYASVNVNVEAGSGGDISINGIVEQYKVNTGATVNAGDFVEFVNKFGIGTFANEAVSYVSACKLDNTRALVVYCRNSDGYGMAVVLSVGDNGVDVGESVVFNAATTAYTSAASLADGKALVVYSDGANSNYGTAVVLSVNGTRITIGAPTSMYSYPTAWISATFLAENKVFVAAETDEGTYRCVTGIVLTVSDTTVTAGARRHLQIYLAANNPNYVFSGIAATTLTEDKVLVVYAGSANNYNDAHAIVATISDTTITPGTPRTYAEDVSSLCNQALAALTESKAIVIYRTYSTATSSNTMWGMILNISGPVISNGARVVVNYAQPTFISISAISEDKAVVVSRFNECDARLLKISADDMITVQKQVYFAKRVSDYSSVVIFSDGSALVPYNTGAGVFDTLTIDGDNLLASGAEIGTYVQPATSRLHNVGVAKTGGAEGQTVDIYCVRTS